MKLLLDTHALLWWLSGSPQLGSLAKNLIGDPQNDILVSVASLWEIVVKVRVGKLAADINDILKEMQAQGFMLLAIGPAHLLALATLPIHHKDPFDHILIAQAIVEGATFLSEDGHTPRYPVRYVTCSAIASTPGNPR